VECNCGLARHPQFGEASLLGGDRTKRLLRLEGGKLGSSRRTLRLEIADRALQGGRRRRADATDGSNCESEGREGEAESGAVTEGRGAEQNGHVI
jgi:hypothetical protein